MSRNLATQTCYFCDTYPVLEEEPRPITKDDAGVYYDDYQGMLVANAHCPQCLAKYLAWVKEGAHFREKYGGRESVLADYGDEATHIDLSFRSTFNDEPSEDDIPEYEVVYEPRRVGPYRGFWWKVYEDRRKEKEENAK